MKKFLGKYIGNKKFYRMVLLVTIPIMIQNGITNLVSLLDNIMVGRVGTEQMSGVAIVNQLMLVYMKHTGKFTMKLITSVFLAQSAVQESLEHSFMEKEIIRVCVMHSGLSWWHA